MRGSKRTAEELDLELVKHPSKEDPFAKVNKDGYYLCTSCGNALYSSEDKFSSDSKYLSPVLKAKSTFRFPAFRKGLPKALKYKYDYTYGMKRTEIICGTVTFYVSSCCLTRGSVKDMLVTFTETLRWQVIETPTQR